MNLTLSRFDSPLGELLIVTDSQARLRALGFADHESKLRRQLRERYGSCELVVATPPASLLEALESYLAGHPAALPDIPIATSGSTLERAVWAAVRRIAPGETQSYGELARALGFPDPRAAIEIGAAVGANLLAIVVPCHRVIGKNGDLKGFAWGLHRKRWLLEHEGALRPSVPVYAPVSARLPGL